MVCPPGETRINELISKPIERINEYQTHRINIESNRYEDWLQLSSDDREEVWTWNTLFRSFFFVQPRISWRVWVDLKVTFRRLLALDAMKLFSCNHLQLGDDSAPDFVSLPATTVRAIIFEPFSKNYPRLIVSPHAKCYYPIHPFSPSL